MLVGFQHISDLSTGRPDVRITGSRMAWILYWDLISRRSKQTKDRMLTEQKLDSWQNLINREEFSPRLESENSDKTTSVKGWLTLIMSPLTLNISFVHQILKRKGIKSFYFSLYLWVCFHMKWVLSHLST